MGHDISCEIASVGINRSKMFDGVLRMLGDVKHITDPKRNHILLSTLDSQGCIYTGEHGVLRGCNVLMQWWEDRKKD